MGFSFRFVVVFWKLFRFFLLFFFLSNCVNFNEEFHSCLQLSLGINVSNGNLATHNTRITFYFTLSLFFNFFCTFIIAIAVI